MSESCSDAGMLASPVSSTALVSSSTNSGTPSVRAMIASIVSLGRRSPPRRATIASTPARPRRLRVRRVTCGWAASAGWWSGRLVSRMQDPGGGDPVQALLDHLERGRVDPVGVLEHHQDRLPGGQPEQLLDQRLERPRPLRLRRQIERAIARRCRRGRAGRRSGARRRARPPGRAAPPACRAWPRSGRPQPGPPRGSAAGSPATARCRCGRASTGSGRESAAPRPGRRAARG